LIRRSAASLALVGLVAGCSFLYADRAEKPKAGAPGKPRPLTPLRAPAPGRPASHRVYVSVVDGDRSRLLRRAIVRVGASARKVGRDGIAAFNVRRPASLRVTVWAPGYRERTVRMPFKKRRWVTVRAYRPALQWPMYGADPARSQTQAGIRLRPPFRVVWSRGLGALIEFPAVVSDGVAYIGNARGTVRALSMRDGRVGWRRETHGPMAASPAVVGDELVVHGMGGRVFVLDRDNGRVRWSFRIGSAIESSPVVRRGLDVFGAWNGYVYGLDLRTRRLRWRFRSGYKITSSASIAGATAYIGDYGGRLLALDLRSGRLRWSRSVNGRVYGTPALAGRRVFVPSSTGDSLTAFSTAGRRLWSARTGGYVYSSPAVWGGRVYVGSYDGRLRCLSARSGRVLWSVAAGGPVSGAVAVVGGVAYAGSTAGRIVGADARTGRVLLRFPHGGYVPVSGNGGRLLLHGYSRLYAVAER
jgi:outer membrane protein assembly factor BamB